MGEAISENNTEDLLQTFITKIIIMYNEHTVYNERNVAYDIVYIYV